MGRLKMGWKKNTFSYVMWFCYGVVAGGTGLVLAWNFCVQAGIGTYWGIVFAAAAATGAGAAVLGLGRMESKISSFVQENRRLLLPVELMWLGAFLALGLVLRIHGINSAEQASQYFDAAMVVEGQEIPRVVHGGTYFYVQLLHTALRFLGNQYRVGIWLQILLQLAGLLLLYFVIRKLAGAVSALVFFGFCSCSPYMVEKTLQLSPQMLCFAIFAAGAVLMTVACWGPLQRKPFFTAGAVAAVCCFIDLTGGLLLVLALSLVFRFRGEEKPDKKEKLAAVLYCLGGAAVGFFLCTYVDASFSGKTVQRVANAWFLLYQPKGSEFSAGLEGFGSGIEGILLIFLVFLGVFSFWRHRQKEWVTVCILPVCVLLAGAFGGIFTQAVPGLFFLYLYFVVLAGVGTGQCFQFQPLSDALSEAAVAGGDVEILDLEQETFPRQEAAAGEELEVISLQESTEESLEQEYFAAEAPEVVQEQEYAGEVSEGIQGREFIGEEPEEILEQEYAEEEPEGIQGQGYRGEVSEGSQEQEYTEETPEGILEQEYIKEVLEGLLEQGFAEEISEEILEQEYIAKEVEEILEQENREEVSEQGYTEEASKDISEQPLPMNRRALPMGSRALPMGGEALSVKQSGQLRGGQEEPVETQAQKPALGAEEDLTSERPEQKPAAAMPDKEALAAAARMLDQEAAPKAAQAPEQVYVVGAVKISEQENVMEVVELEPIPDPAPQKIRRQGESSGEAKETKEPKEHKESKVAEPVRKIIRFLENPLPLPRKHVKRELEYSIRHVADDDDFDYAVAEDDDFDIE